MAYAFVRQVALSDATEMVNSVGYYGDVASADLAGTDLYGILYNDKLVACVMIIHKGAQAYLDYLCVHPDHRQGIVALKLLSGVKDDLRRHKVTCVHTCVRGTNVAAMKLLKFYEAEVGWPYMNGVIRLEDRNG